MTDIVTQLVEQAKRASERAVVSAINGDFDVEVRRDGGVRVEDQVDARTHTVTLTDVTPGEESQDGDDAMADYEVVVLSHLLNDVLALYRVLRHAGERLAVRVPNADAPVELVGKATRSAGEIHVKGTSFLGYLRDKATSFRDYLRDRREALHEHWRDEYGWDVTPDESVVTVRFAGSDKREYYPVSALAVRPSLSIPE